MREPGWPLPPRVHKDEWTRILIKIMTICRGAGVESIEVVTLGGGKDARCPFVSAATEGAEKRTFVVLQHNQVYVWSSSFLKDS